MKPQVVKLRETEFVRQFVTVVAGTLLVVMSCAFVAIPATLGASPGTTPPARVPQHLT